MALATSNTVLTFGATAEVCGVVLRVRAHKQTPVSHHLYLSASFLARLGAQYTTCNARAQLKTTPGKGPFEPLSCGLTEASPRSTAQHQLNQRHDYHY